MSTRWEREIITGDPKAGPLADLFYPSEFVDDGCYVTKAGHIACVLRVGALPYEILDPADLDERCSRFESAVRGFSNEIRTYQFIRKQEVTHIPTQPCGEPLLDRLTASRNEFLVTTAGPLHDIDVFYALVYEGDPSAAMKAFFRPAKAAAQLDAAIYQDTHLLRTQASAFIQGLRDILKIELLGADAVFAFLRSLVTYGPEDKGLHLKTPYNLERQMSAATVEADGALQVGKHLVRVLTLSEEPRATDSHLFSKLLETPGNVFIVSEWKRVSAKETDSLIRSQRRHLNKLLEGRTMKAAKDSKPHEILLDEGKRWTIEQLGEALRDIEREGLYFGEFSLAFVLIHENPDRLRVAEAHIKSVLHTHGAQATEHFGRRALMAWLAIIPGNMVYNRRRLKLSSVSFGHLAFLFAPPKGEAWNQHLDAPAMSVLTTQQKTIYHFTQQVGQVGHGITFGRIRSGKSVRLKMKVAEVQKYGKLRILPDGSEVYEYPYTVIFDVTREMRQITEAFGGSYMEMGRPDGSATIAPFSNEPTPAHLEFLYEFIPFLIMLDGGPKLNAEQTEDVKQQTDSLYHASVPAEYRRLGELGLSDELMERLAPWIRMKRKGRTVVGQYAYLFDNTVDTLSFAHFQAFTFPDMKSSPRALSALLHYLLHRSLQFIYAVDRPSFVFMDEAANFLENPTTLQYILRALRNWPKQDASLDMSLHSLTDAPPEVLQPIIEKCLTQTFFSNPGADLGQWRKFLKLSEAEVKIISHLPPYKMLEKGKGVLDIILDPESLKLYSTGKEKKTRGQNSDSVDMRRIHDGGTQEAGNGHNASAGGSGHHRPYEIVSAG